MSTARSIPPGRDHWHALPLAKTKHSTRLCTSQSTFSYAARTNKGRDFRKRPGSHTRGSNYGAFVFAQMRHSVSIYEVRVNLTGRIDVN